MNRATPSTTPSRHARARTTAIVAFTGALACTIALTACQNDDAAGDPSSTSTQHPTGSSSTASSNPKKPESSTTASKSSSKTSTPAPARADEVKEAQAAYAKYVKAYIRAEKIDPPAGDPPKSLQNMATGPESKWLKNVFNHEKKSTTFLSSGSVAISMSNEVAYDSTEINKIRFKACWDQRSIIAEHDGDQSKPPSWVLNKVEMRHIATNNGTRRWLTYTQTDQKQNPKDSCEFD